MQQLLTALNPNSQVVGGGGPMHKLEHKLQQVELHSSYYKPEVDIQAFTLTITDPSETTEVPGNVELVTVY